MIEVHRHNPGWEVLSAIIHAALFAALVLATPVRKLVLPEREPSPPPAEQASPDKLEHIGERLTQARERELQRDIATLQTVLNDMDVVRDRLREDFDDIVEDLAASAKEELRKATEEARELQRQVLEKQDATATAVDRLAEAERGDLEKTAAAVDETANHLYWNEFMDVAAAQANAQNALDRVQTAAAFAGYEKVAQAAADLRDAQIAAARLQSSEAKDILAPAEKLSGYRQAAADQEEFEKRAEAERRNEAENQGKSDQAKAEQQQAQQRRDEADARRAEAEQQRNEAENARREAQNQKNAADNEKRQAEGRKRDAENRSRQAQNDENAAKNREQQASREEAAAQERGRKAEGERKAAEERAGKASQEQQQAKERAEQASREQQQAKQTAEQAGRDEKAARDRETAARRENRAEDAAAAKAEAEQKAREKADATKAEQQARGRKDQASREEQQARSRKDQASREAQQAQQRRDQATREENQARERKERAASDARAAAARREEHNRAAATENEKAQQADQSAKAAQERAAAAERERNDAQRRMDAARGERDRAENDRRNAENRARDADGRAQNAANHAKANAERASDAKRRREEMAAFARSIDTAAQRARQDNAKKAQQDVLDAMARLDEAIATDVAAPREHPPAEDPGGELARRNASQLSISEAYEFARELEEAVTESYREVVAATTAISQHLTLEEAERLTDVAKPVREDFDPALLDGRARTAEQLSAQKEARYKAVRETENMVDASMAMMDEAFRLAGFGGDGEFRNGNRRQARGLAWLRHGDLDGRGGPARTDRFHALSGLAGQLESAASEDRGARAKDLTSLTKMGGVAQFGDRPPEEDYQRIAGHSDAYRGQPGLRAGDWRTGPGTGADLLPGNVLSFSESSRGMPGAWMFLESWWVIGPFPNPDRVNITRKFPPESVIDLDAAYQGEGGLVQWQFVQARNSFNVNGRHVRAEVRPRSPREFAIWYGWTQLVVDRECDVWLAAGSDDRSDVWINGMKVWASGNNRKVWDIAEGFRKVHLLKGVNTVLVRLENGPGPTGFSVCISPHDPPPPL